MGTMRQKVIQIVANLVLYGFLLWQLYESTIADQDFWYAFVVGFVLIVALGITLVPSLHAKGVSPGKYPYDE